MKLNHCTGVSIDINRQEFPADFNEEHIDTLNVLKDRFH